MRPEKSQKLSSCALYRQQFSIPPADVRSKKCFFFGKLINIPRARCLCAKKFIEPDPQIVKWRLANYVFARADPWNIGSTSRILVEVGSSLNVSCVATAIKSKQTSRWIEMLRSLKRLMCKKEQRRWQWTCKHHHGVASRRRLSYTCGWLEMR